KGMSVMAAGARQAGACMWSGMGSEAELEEITQTGAKTIKIIKPYADRDKVHRKIEHAKSLGVLAVGMDVDHQFAGNGGYDNVFGDEMRPVSAKELRDLVEAAKIPFVVKGVLSGIDACKCQEAGVAGIVVSHHHGIMPYAVPPLRMLPEIRRIVGKDFPVFLDCGIESGADVYKALALGADAVCVGRALMDTLKDDGAAGVARKITQMNDELKGFMARTAVHNLAAMDAGVIVHMNK
ncbi:MAG: alpha-hydroxy-acid oxidizing protein, partial [Lachnospiraceae bacterium]|nr:alpha-hydroxy-acid oxidizing protein [Lachnospiraceae bacterium]